MSPPPSSGGTFVLPHANVRAPEEATSMALNVCRVPSHGPRERPGPKVVTEAMLTASHRNTAEAGGAGKAISSARVREELVRGH